MKIKKQARSHTDDLGGEIKLTGFGDWKPMKLISADGYYKYDGKHGKIDLSINNRTLHHRFTSFGCDESFVLEMDKWKVKFAEYVYGYESKDEPLSAHVVFTSISNEAHMYIRMLSLKGTIADNKEFLAALVEASANTKDTSE